MQATTSLDVNSSKLKSAQPVKNTYVTLAASDNMGLSVSTKSSSLEQQTNSPSPLTYQSHTSCQTISTKDIQNYQVLSSFAEIMPQNCNQANLNGNEIDFQRNLMKNIELKKLSSSSNENTDELLT